MNKGTEKLFGTEVEAFLGLRYTRMLVRLLKEIENFEKVKSRPPYTREILSIIKTWTHGHYILTLAESLGFIERYEGYLIRKKAKIKVTFNKITELGRQFIEIYKPIEETKEAE